MAFKALQQAGGIITLATVVRYRPSIRSGGLRFAQVLAPPEVALAFDTPKLAELAQPKLCAAAIPCASRMRDARQVLQLPLRSG